MTGRRAREKVPNMVRRRLAATGERSYLDENGSILPFNLSLGGAQKIGIVLT
jgi:hypothetical protein